MRGIGKKIFEFRSEHDLTQAQFAKITKISRVTINRVEKGKIKLQAKTHGKIMDIIKPIDRKGRK